MVNKETEEPAVAVASTSQSSPESAEHASNSPEVGAPVAKQGQEQNGDSNASQSQEVPKDQAGVAVAQPQEVPKDQAGVAVAQPQEVPKDQAGVAVAQSQEAPKDQAGVAVAQSKTPEIDDAETAYTPAPEEASPQQDPVEGAAYAKVAQQSTADFGIDSYSGPPTDQLIGRILEGRYRVKRKLDAGGMGTVYVAEQLGLGREVALKILHNDLMNSEQVRKRFRREATIVSRLNHPNTIRLFEYFEIENGPAVMAMELLHGESLSDRLRSGRTLDVRQTLVLGEEIASSLDEAHLNGLVHRDLKPGNIFLVDLNGQPHAKVLDFGIARIVEEEATRLTADGQIFGTPRYMSPEQAYSTADVDSRADIYSLGLILFECVVGKPPFVAETSLQYLTAHSTMTPPKLRDVYPEAPESLEILIDDCLAKDSSLRPQSAEILKTRLQQIRMALESKEGFATTHIPGSVVGAGAVSATGSSSAGGWLWAGIAAVIGILTVGFLFSDAIQEQLEKYRNKTVLIEVLDDSTQESLTTNNSETPQIQTLKGQEDQPEPKVIELVEESEPTKPTTPQLPEVDVEDTVEPKLSDNMPEKTAPKKPAEPQGQSNVVETRTFVMPTLEADD